MEPFTMMLLASSALGALQGAEAAKRRKKDEAFRREAIRYSPWTEMTDPGESKSRGNFLTGAAEGGLTGAMLGKSMDAKGGENWFNADKSDLAKQAESLAPSVSGDVPFQGLADYNANLQPAPDTGNMMGGLSTSVLPGANTAMPSEQDTQMSNLSMAPQEGFAQPYTGMLMGSAPAPTTALGGAKQMRRPRKMNPPAFSQQQGPWRSQLNLGF